MIGLNKPRPAEGEVLPPEPWSESVSYLMPVAVRTWYEMDRMATVVKLQDGGVWVLPDRQLQSIDPGDVRANIAEIFARWPERFAFRRREASCYRGTV
jgi:hypothetical protein